MTNGLIQHIKVEESTSKQRVEGKNMQLVHAGRALPSRKTSWKSQKLLFLCQKGEKIYGKE